VKMRKQQGDGVKIDMTPMIDVVFQLLTFFLMTFKISAQEGDFNVKMPLAAPRQGVPDPTQTPPLKLVMKAGGDGNLSSMTISNRSFGNFQEFHDYVIGYVGDDRGPGSLQQTAELELDCDSNLKYENVIKAITAASGYLDDNQNVVRLIEKIKFSPPKG
jgi:biopolymer transport protein ExbD